MVIQSIEKIKKGDKAILRAQINSQAFTNPQSVFFSYPGRFLDFLPETADPFFPAMLIPSMLSGEDLEIIPPISSRLLENQQTIQDILSTWHPLDFKKINLIAQNVSGKSPEKKNRNATFFSLGVDSMYTMLKHLPVNKPAPGRGLSSLIYMKGLELPLSVYSKGQDQEVINASKKVADHYNLELIVGETNLRDVFPLDWEDHYFGPGLAATALSLSKGFKNVYIPSSHSYAFFFHDPSSPLLDHLWSNEHTHIFHDGAEKERAQKIADLIANDSYALNNLRVCVDNEGGIQNCGNCAKCIRTMITLEIIGRLKSAASFPDELPEDYFRRLNTFIPDSLEFTRENLKLARKYGRKDLEKHLEREIRIGELDVFRGGKPVGYLLKEMGFYLQVKIARKLRLIS